MPHSGLFWTKDAVLVPCKILLGIGRWDAITKNDAEGWWATGSKNKAVQLLGDVMPFAIDQIRRDHTGVVPVENIIMYRARASSPKELGHHGGGEIGRFMVPEFRSSFNFMSDTYAKKSSITADDLFAAQEKLLLGLFSDCIGVYVRVDPEIQERAYIGRTKNLAKRHHSNASHRLARVYPTITVPASIDIETELLRLTAEHPKIQKATQGLVQFKSGTSAIKMIDELVNSLTWAKSLFRNTHEPKEGHQVEKLRLHTLKLFSKERKTDGSE
jgi:hypothetical protein